MGKIGKTFALILTLIIAMSCVTLLTVKPVNAQSIPTPSVPQFTVQYVVYTSYIAPTYTINPYTGQNQTLTGGYTQENQTIEFTIENQPFTLYTDSSGNLIRLYYNFGVKGHFTDTWTPYPFASVGQSTCQSTWRYYGGLMNPQENLGSPEYTASNSRYTLSSVDVKFFSLQSIPSNSQVDFQVQALIGHIDPITYQMNPNIGGEGYYSFTGQASDWSTMQTITIDLNSNSTISTTSPSTLSTTTPTSTLTSTSTPTLTPSVPELSWLVTLPFFAVATLLSIAFIRKKLTKKS